MVNRFLALVPKPVPADAPLVIEAKPEPATPVPEPAQPKPEVEPGPKLGAADEALATLNELHAIINNVGGKTVIASWEPSVADSNKLTLVYQSQTDFNLRYSNRYMPVGVSGRHGGAQTIMMLLGKWWLSHPGRKQYRSIVFLPTQPKEVNGCLNLWQSWGVEDIQADWSLIYRHIIEVVADDNAEIAEYVIRWMAWSIQNPDKQAEVALVFIGEKGAGKGTVARCLQRIFGAHSFQVSGADDVVGKFNAHLQDCILFIADEAFWGGDKKSVGKLQGMITEPTITVEPKGIGLFQVRNLLHILMLAEPGWVIPAGRHERRYAALDVSPVHRGDRAYFKALRAQIEGDGPAGMFHDLSRMDIGTWHPREIPDVILHGSALHKQQNRTLPPLERWYLMLLHEGQLPGALVKRPNTAFTESLISDAKSKYARLRLDLTPESLRNFLIDPVSTGIKCDKYKTAQCNGWAFPPLGECREAWSRIYGHVDWDTDAEEWTAGPQPVKPSSKELTESATEILKRRF